MLTLTVSADFANRLRLVATTALYLFAGMALLSSCSSRMPVSNPIYKKIFASFDSVPVGERSAFLDSVNNVMFKKDPPGADEMVLYYRMRCDLLRDANIVGFLSTLDSLEVFLLTHNYIPGYKNYYAQMLTAKVEGYTLMRQYEEALQILAQAKQYIDEKFDDPCVKGQFNLAFADILYRQTRFRLAAAYYLELFNNAQLCDSSSFNRFYYSYSGMANAGLSYYSARMFDSAQHYLNRAIDVIDTYEPRFPDKSTYFDWCRAVVSTNLAATKMDLKEYAAAEKLMQLAIRATEKENPSWARGTRYDLAQLYTETMQLDKAAAVLRILDSTFDKPKLSYSRDYSLTSIKRKYYQKAGDNDAALYYNDLALATRDSIDLVRRKNLDRDFAMEFSASEQKKINELLRIKNEQTSLHLQLAILLMVIALLIIALIWSNLRRASRYSNNLRMLNKEVNLKNKDILDAYALLEDSYLVNKSLMRTVAHDLKNPLGAITSLVRWLNKKAEAPDVKDTLHLIDNACSNSIDLINDMVKSDTLKFTRIHKEMNDMLRLLEYCVEMMKPRADEKHQQLLLEAQHVEAFINKDKIWRVITNIINNAIKFSPEKTVIYVRLEKLESELVLSVRDNGIGIPEHLQHKIFESSPEAQRAGTSGEQSYGLGLNISKKIVEEHNGRLWVESAEGQGSTFFVMLPSGN